MKDNVVVSSSGGIGFIGALTIAFIVLKLTGIIAWSWVWVLSPLWITFAIWAVVILVFLIAAFKPFSSFRRKAKRTKLNK